MKRLGSKQAQVITNKRNGLLVTAQLVVDAMMISADVGVLVKEYLGIKAIALPSNRSCFKDGTISASDSMA